MFERIMASSLTSIDREAFQGIDTVSPKVVGEHRLDFRFAKRIIFERLEVWMKSGLAEEGS